MNFKKQLKDGLIYQNPVLVQVLGMCSTMAITTSISNGVGMGISVLIILTLSNIFISLLRKIIPNEVRIACYTVVLVIMCTVRELLGAGTLMGIQIMPASYTPALMLVLPVGGFLCLGTLIAVMQWALAKGEKKAAEKNEKEGN